MNIISCKLFSIFALISAVFFSHGFGMQDEQLLEAISVHIDETGDKFYRECLEIINNAPDALAEVQDLKVRYIAGFKSFIATFCITNPRARTFQLGCENRFAALIRSIEAFVRLW